MELPHGHLAYVERTKIADYLLNTMHPHGAPKARFFQGFGFTADRWEILANALTEHGRRHPVASMTKTAFGVRYEVDGDVIAPDGRSPWIRSVWHVDAGEIAPRLITAYPLARSGR